MARCGDDVEAKADGERDKDPVLPNLPEESFDFLGYTIGRCYSPRTGEAYLGPGRPGSRSILIGRRSGAMTGRTAVGCVRTVVAEINRITERLGELFPPGARSAKPTGRGTTHVRGFADG